MKYFLIMIACTFFSPAMAEETTLTLLTLNDVYDILPRNGYGGLAEMMTILKQEREEATHYLTTVNGDFLSPSLISGIFHGSQMVELFNLMEVDVVVFGNHEFDFGIDILTQRMQESHFCWLGSNVLTLHKGIPFNKAQSSVLFDVDGITVGMIGICTPETNLLVRDVADVTFTPAIMSAQAAVHKLKKEGADVIIALTHLNFEEDLQLAMQVPEIDLILGGHDHDVMTWYNGKTLVHKSGHDAQYLGRVDLKMEKKKVGDKTKLSIYPIWKMVPNHGFSKDSDLEKAIAYYVDRIDDELSQQIAVCQNALDSSNVRTHETTMGNLITDSMREVLQADGAIINGGAIRGGKLYLPGTSLTKRDIQEALPFGNIAVLVEVTGEQLLTTLENCLSKVESKAGNFPQVSGIQVLYDSGGKLGSRVCEALVKGEPIDKTKKYRLATTDYLLRGGDGNTGLKNTKALIGAGVGPLLTSIVIDYVQTRGSAASKLEGRILDCNVVVDVKKAESTGRRIRF